GGAVVVAHIFGILQKFSPADAGLKLLPGDEVVVHPVLLPLPGGPGGKGDGKVKVGPPGQHLGQHRALPRPGKARDHHQGSSLSHSSSSPASSSRPPRRPATVSGWRAERMIWSLSVISTARVRRP